MTAKTENRSKKVMNKSMENRTANRGAIFIS